MADFCKQCSISLFGQDYGDMKMSDSKSLKQGEGFSVLCEGCGPTLVGKDGECLFANENEPPEKMGYLHSHSQPGESAGKN